MLDEIDAVGETQSGADHAKWTDVGEASGGTFSRLRRRRRRRRRRCVRTSGAGSDDGPGGSNTLAPLTKTNSLGSVGVALFPSLGRLAVLRSRRGHRSLTSRDVTTGSS